MKGALEARIVYTSIAREIVDEYRQVYVWTNGQKATVWLISFSTPNEEWKTVVVP